MSLPDERTDVVALRHRAGTTSRSVRQCLRDPSLLIVEHDHDRIAALNAEAVKLWECGDAS
jgi:hypothetical protein